MLPAVAGRPPSGHEYKCIGASAEYDYVEECYGSGFELFGELAGN